MHNFIVYFVQKQKNGSVNYINEGSIFLAPAKREASKLVAKHYKVEYYDSNWVEDLSTYAELENYVWVFVDQCQSIDYRKLYIDRAIAHFFGKPQKLICDCGCDKTYGKYNSVHSHWCSAKTQTNNVRF